MVDVGTQLETLFMWLAPAAAASEKPAPDLNPLDRGDFRALWDSLYGPVTRGDWSAVTTIASSQVAERTADLARLAEVQAAYAERLAPEPLPDLHSIGRLDTLPYWKEVSAEIHKQAAAAGKPASYADMVVKQAGKVLLSPAEMRDAFAEEYFPVLSRADRLFTRHLRSLMGARLAEVTAAMNTATAGAPVDESTAGAIRAELDAAEKALFDAMRTGPSGAAVTAQALAEAGQAAQQKLVAAGIATRRPQPDRAALAADEAMRAALRAEAAGRYAAWMLAWPSYLTSAHRFHRRTAGLPFDGAPIKDIDVAAVSDAHGTVRIAGTIASVEDAGHGSELTLTDGGASAVVQLRWSSLPRAGCEAGAWASAVVTVERGRCTAQYLGLDDPVDTWREAVTQATRGAYLDAPYGVQIRWSWTPSGIARQITRMLWFS